MSEISYSFWEMLQSLGIIVSKSSFRETILLLVLSHCLFVREVFILLVVLQFSSHFYLFYLLKLFAFRKVIFDYESTIKKYKSGAFLVVQ